MTPLWDLSLGAAVHQIRLTFKGQVVLTGLRDGALKALSGLEQRRSGPCESPSELTSSDMRAHDGEVSDRSDGLGDIWPPITHMPHGSHLSPSSTFKRLDVSEERFRR